MRILVRATNWLGDAVMSLPALRALRARFPEAHIAVVARAWVAGLYRREPCADWVIEDGGALRTRHFDIAVLLPNSFDAALTAWLAGIPRRIGYDRDGRGLLLTDPIPAPARGEIPPHESFYYLELLRRAGLVEELPAAQPIVLSGAEEARRQGEELFRAMGLPSPRIGISPGAHNSRAKQWPPGCFVEAAARLAAELSGAVAVFGSSEERPLGQWVAAALRRSGCAVLNLAGETGLGEFISLAAACRVFLSNDSGAMHVASALGVPTVAVFGPTEWFATAPAGPRSQIVREPVECSPCMLRDCPIDHRCMTRISPERVVRAALDLLQWNGDRRS